MVWISLFCIIVAAAAFTLFRPNSFPEHILSPKLNATNLFDDSEIVLLLSEIHLSGLIHHNIL